MRRCRPLCTVQSTNGIKHAFWRKRIAGSKLSCAWLPPALHVSEACAGTRRRLQQCLNACAEGGSEEIDGNLVALLQKDEVVRKVTQIFCLERLASGDTITTRTLLANMVAVRFTSPLHLDVDGAGGLQQGFSGQTVHCTGGRGLAVSGRAWPSSRWLQDAC